MIKYKKRFIKWVASILGIHIYFNQDIYPVKEIVIERHHLEKFKIERDFNTIDIQNMYSIMGKEGIMPYMNKEFANGMVDGIYELISKNPQLIEMFKEVTPRHNQIETWRFEMYLNIDNRPPMPTRYKNLNAIKL